MFQVCRSLSMKTGFAPEIGNGVGCGRERESRCNDLVAATHPDYRERQVQGSRSRREGRRRADADLLGELPLEGVHVGPERGNPIRVEGIQEQTPLMPRHVRGRKVNPRRYSVLRRHDLPLGLDKNTASCIDSRGVPD